MTPSGRHARRSCWRGAGRGDTPVYDYSSSQPVSALLQSCPSVGDTRRCVAGATFATSSKIRPNTQSVSLQRCLNPKEPWQVGACALVEPHHSGCVANAAQGDVESQATQQCLNPEEPRLVFACVSGEAHHYDYVANAAGTDDSQAGEGARIEWQHAKTGAAEKQLFSFLARRHEDGH